MKCHSEKQSKVIHVEFVLVKRWLVPGTMATSIHLVTLDH